MIDDEQLRYIISHIFLPPKLPQEDDFKVTREHALCGVILQAAEAYSQVTRSAGHEVQWRLILKMLKNVHISQESLALLEDRITECIEEMQSGDVLAFLIRAQNAGIIMRKSKEETVFESFEVSPQSNVVMSTKGKLLCSYPGPAVAVPREIVDNLLFRQELASFLVQMNVDILDSAPTTIKAGSEVQEERDTAHPRYITQLLTEILRGMGHAADVTRIRKRIADDVLWSDAFKPWRRSSIYLVIRVALQTSLHQPADEPSEYKVFMVYMMAKVLYLALERGFPSDLIFCMRAKMSRRLFKLGTTAPDFLLQFVREAGNAAQSLLQQRWLEVQRDQAASTFWAPEQLDIAADTRLSLVKSKSYLSQVLLSAFPPPSPNAFKPDHSPRFHGSCNFDAADNRLLLNGFTKNAHIALMDFELAVQDHLDEWVAENLLRSSCCATIGACISQYADAALSAYRSNPESLSVMLLTIFDLWVGLDKVAIEQCPLLKDYSPEVPLGLLEPLLLRRSKSFERLRSIEEYVRRRHLCARPGHSVFTSGMNRNSFAIRYYDSSPDHLELRQRIEKDAEVQKAKKIQELQGLNADYRSLRNQSLAMDHKYQINKRGESSHKRKRCTKCSLDTRASKLKIDVHEWPLPHNPFEAKATVFELFLPPVFGVWRMTTYKILYDICTPVHRGSANFSVQLDEYQGLRNYMHDKALRISLASETKSFLVSHYRKTSIPKEAASVCVENGLRFRLFDKFRNEWIAESFASCSIARYCTLLLPDGPYKSLQYAVDGTCHTSNQVLANQSECPRDLTLHEYIAFASLRSGPRLQWLNIARELPARSLTFNTEAVHILLMQAVWQVGPLSQSRNREWHAELRNANFALVLLNELQDLLVSIRANWLEAASVRTIIVITGRLLASRVDTQVTEKAYSLLREARAVTYEWMHQIARKLQDSEDEDQVRDFQSRICEMAATCRGTYDVDPKHVSRLLNSPADLSILVECAILAYSNSPLDVEEAPLELRRLLHRDRQLSHSLEALLCQLIVKFREGLDDAIACIWAGYRPEGQWLHFTTPSDRWITTNTAVEGDQKSQSVQLNIIEGRLLIDGKPLGRLPPNIVMHSLYSRIMGQKILDVVPADIPGMEFATRDLISGYQVYFGMRDGTSLVIQAKRGFEHFELIPHHKFTDDLPTLLVEGYAHWLNLPNSEIELRPITNLWEPSSQNWRIQFSVSGHSKMFKGSSLALVDIRSPTALMISARLAPLESLNYLEVTRSQDDDGLVVHLPRFRLSFYLNDEGQLESQNMPGMSIDANQSSGTMFGLSSQLILCSKETKHLPRLRHIIIPYGNIIFQPRGNHVSISVDTKSQSHVRYQEYSIDTDLCRLVGNVSMISRLYKIYLHAVSSHCMPDPLTGRTGTEEALHGLRSAGCLSFQKLRTDERDVLRQISSLTPARTFYPAHLEVMQTVNWNNLVPTAQHYEFHILTQSVMEYAKSLQVFDSQSELEARDPDSSLPTSKNVHLLKRAALRNALFYPEEFSGPLPSEKDDVVHVSRDISVYRTTDDECAVAAVSRTIHNWPSRLNTYHRLLDTFKEWESLSRSDDIISLSYNHCWLERDFLPETWLSLYDLCRRSSRDRNSFQLVFSLSALAYSSPEVRHLIPTILSFATIPRFRTLHPPSCSSYDLTKGFCLDAKSLRDIIDCSAVSFESCSISLLPAYPGEHAAALGKRRFSTFKTRKDSQAKVLFEYLKNQWPCEKPRSPPSQSDEGSWLFDITRLVKCAREAFRSWFENLQLGAHVREVQDVLDQVHCPNGMPTGLSAYRLVPCSKSYPSAASRIELNQLLARDPPDIRYTPPILEIPETFPEYSNSITELGVLLSEFKCKPNVFHRRYGNDLDESRKSLHHEVKLTSFSTGPSHSLELIADHKDKCLKHVEYILSSIYQSLQPLCISEEVILTSGQWPRLTTGSLLCKLTFRMESGLTRQWKTVLISLVQALLRFQRSQRLLRLADGRNWEEFLKELGSKGINDQDGVPNPDWLLIQVENNFLVRPIQIQVAQEMVAPTSNQNTTLQLNMGEGKSSVIVPMVASALSDGRKFVRVVVLKSLATQMFQLLVERLSGLTNRRIFYMPFSRTATLTIHQVQLIQNLYVECMRVGGILVSQPEHILSFKLMGIDQTFHNAPTAGHEIADTLLQSQRWLEKNSRDILDESDEILHVRYQLVYTVGQQQSLEGHPDRWTTVQQILSLVRKHAPEIQRRFPLGIEVQDNGVGCYPSIRILQPGAGKALVFSIAEDVMNGVLSSSSFGLLSPHLRKAVRLFITEMVIPKEDADLLEEHCNGTGTWNVVLLLRGLLASGILIYVLEGRRWRVDYGLDHSRSMLAVPYRAKDVPSLRAEFGHPDVAITLTCLSYYFTGLSQDQVDQSFDLMYKQDNPSLEYEKWIFNNASIPEQLRRLTGVNTKDPEQHQLYLYPLFHKNHAVIDFFLSAVVFPKEAKEFPEKLATSGWDLAESKAHFTTGFSGTNDGRYLLPTSITQDDPVNQLSTNAKVLNYLLQPENDYYLCTHQEDRLSSAKGFLDHLANQTPEIRVLLDVGAQILEFQNKELAEHWLEIRTDIPAVLFFDNDELAVLMRDGAVEPLISSPFKQQLDQCLVYLDESHTRGTDLKLPRNYRAAVTLGPKVTKDKLLQGCMRMRKLGHGQSVMFFAPPEVDRNIRTAAGKDPSHQISVLDILRWAMLETCAEVIHHIPQWAQQGLDYRRRQQAWEKFSSSRNPSLDDLKSAWVQPEARTLEEMYGLPLFAKGNQSLRHAAFDVPELKERCLEFGISSFSDTSLEEEQEREVTHEIERERQVERPLKAKAATHHVHEDVRKLVQTGIIIPNSSQFVSILFPLDETTSTSQARNWSPNLLATRDFSTTIQDARRSVSNDYLRPVNWIISSVQPTGSVFVVLSPYEVDNLLPDIKRSNKVHLHQYAPRVTQSMKSFDHLAFYCIPSLPPSWEAPTLELRNQLNLWSGQLYLPDHETYIQLCNFLGLYTKEAVGKVSIESDGFIKPEHRLIALRSKSPFKESPVPFLKEVISVRRKGMGYMPTHVGKILHARLLTEEDFKC